MAQWLLQADTACSKFRTTRELGRGVQRVLLLSSKLGGVPRPFKASLGSSSQKPVRFPVHLCGPEQQERQQQGPPYPAFLLHPFCKDGDS